MAGRKIPGLRKQTLEELKDMVQSDSPLATKGISALATISALKKISGNMILPLMPGHRRPTSGDYRGSMQLDFPSEPKGISVPATLTLMIPAIQKISGNMIQSPIRGHGKLTSGQQGEAP